MKIQSIKKIMLSGVLALGISVVVGNGSSVANAKDNNLRVAPIVYLGKDSKGLYFDDYTCKDFEQQFLVANKQVKKLHLNKSYKQGKYYIGYFKNEVKTYKIHSATEKIIVKNGKKKKVLVDNVNGKVVAK